jgi:hypothetical protein
MKKPRCFKYYKDDRVCDICHVEKDCIFQTKFRIELENSKNRCEHKEWRNTGWENYERCNKNEDVIFCKPNEECFPKLFRKFKLNKIDEI